MAEEETNKTLAGTENRKLRAATEAFQRKYRSMSLYGDHVLEVANRSNRALLCLGEDNSLRFYCKKVVESKTFEYFILLTIASNCIVLTLDKPLPNGDTTELNKNLEVAELVFVVIYFIEAVIKIIAYGFLFHPNAYLRNGWNILDFVVVIVGVVGTTLTLLHTSLHGTESLKVLRAVRVLRPLKLVSGIPSLQVVMKSLARAMMPLLQIMCLVLFVIVIYAMIGLELLRGKFHYTCYENGTDTLDSEFLVPRICSAPGGGGRPCRNGTTCQRHDKSWEGPNSGITTFDNIFLAMLTVFQCITNEGWTTIMYHSYDAREYKVGWITSIIYVSLIIVGSFFMLNLVLGVLSGEFAKERERVENRRAFFKLRRQEQIKRQVENYKDWIAKAEDIMLREEREQHGVGEGGPRDPLKKRISLSDSIMHLIEDRGEILSQLKERSRKNSTATFAERSSFLRKLKKREKRVRLFVRTVVKSQVFYWAVIVCVFLNTLVMSFEYHGQPLWLKETQYMSEIVFLGIFITEMLLKMYGLGPRAYFSSAFNRFDFAVVLCGVIDLVVQNYTKYSFSISVLRSLRLFRIFKFTRFWSSLRNLVTSLLNSMRSILSLIFLLLLFIFIFALLGMTLFGGRFSGKQDAPRTNFDSFEHAMLAVFQIMTGEDWNTVMNHGIEASGGPHSALGMLASLYFVALVILGNYTLLNVFLAIAVDNLANAQALTKDEEEEERAREQSRRRRMQKKKNPWARARQIPMIMAIKNLSNAKNDNPFHNMKPAYSVDHSPRGVRWNNKSALRLKFSQDNSASHDGIQQNGQSTSRTDQENTTDREEENEDENKVSPGNLAKSLRSASRMMRRRNIPRNVPIIRKSSMFIFGPDSPIRRLCHWVVNLRYFDDFILFVIALSSVLLAFESPIEETNEVLKWFDYIITGIFTFEVLIKMIDLGVILHKGSYLRSGWNVIDTFVVACNIAAIILNSNQSTTTTSSTREAIKSFRVFRVFRPIKAINKSKQLKTVFECMMYSVKNVRNILLITLLFYFIFAVIGVQLFKGKFYYCTDPSKMTEWECKGHFFKYKTDLDGGVDLNDFEIKQREWKHHRFTFDNVGDALLTLFSSSTGEGWPDHMHHTIDATEENRGPRRNNQIHMALYYVCFVVVFNFFFLNIFVALIIVTFQEQGEKEIVNCELDRNQRDCIQFAMNARPRQRYMPEDKNTIFYKVWVIVDSKPFEIFTMTLIALNAVVLMLSFDGKGADEVEKILGILNTVFTVLFLLEAILKLIAFKQNYFKDYWNCFDFVIVMTTFVGVVLLYADAERFGIDPSFFRLFRAARLVKLLRQGYTIRILLWTFFQSFKALPYVVILLAMLFFIYAVIGMQLFGRIELSEDWSRHINYHNNFQSFFGALQVLFRCATGENWPLVMQDCFSKQPCNKSLYLPQMDCGNTIYSIIYFVTFYFFCSFLMLNLFVAVIMDNFEYLTRDESILGPHHLDEFVRVWSEYDPGATGRIKHTQVYHLMCDMSPPVGFGRKCPKFIAYKRLIKMNMPIMGDNTVLFTSTLFALIRTALGIFNTGDPAFADGELRRVIKRLWPKTYKKTLDKMIPTQSVLSSQQMTIGKIYCAKLIYENYKHMKKKRLERAEQRRRKLDAFNDESNLSNHHKRRPSLFRRLVDALRSGNSNSDEEEGPRRPSQEYLTMRRRSKTMATLPSFKDKQEEMSQKRRMNRSLKFFRKPFGRNDSNAAESEKDGRISVQRSVHFRDIPMDLTDINPTIISTDTDEETNAEMAPGASGTLSRGIKKRRRSIKLSFKNPVALEDAEEETRARTLVHPPTQMASSPASNLEIRLRSSTGHSSPVHPPTVRIQIPSPQPSVDEDVMGADQNDETNKTSVVALDPFPDVIKSAESSPRHSLAPIGDYFAGFNHPDGHRTREIINQINEEITQAVRRGQSAYALYGIQDNDEETWC